MQVVAILYRSLPTLTSTKRRALTSRDSFTSFGPKLLQLD